MMDPKLNAWLDGELSEAEVTWTPELRAEAESLRRADAALLDWYQEPPVRSTWRLRPLMVAAAAILCVVLLVPLFLRRGAECYAEEALRRTASVLESAKGILVEFAAEAGGRKFSGEIRYGALAESPLPFVCKARWAATADEPELLRDWGQAGGLEWTRERQGGSSVSNSVSRGFDPKDLESYYRDLREGSPVDVRTRQAVEGLAVLAARFGQDSFKHWMGCDWAFAGGNGSVEDPWVYRSSPTTALTWNLAFSVGADGTVNQIRMEEVERGHSTFRVSYTLTPRVEAWPEGTFESKEGGRKW